MEIREPGAHSVQSSGGGASLAGGSSGSNGGSEAPVGGSGVRQLRLAAVPSAIPTMRAMVRGFLDSLQLSTTRSVGIQLAVTEACTNVVRHAYPAGQGDVFCECQATACEIVISVSDWGCGSDQRSARPGLGFGMPLIRRLSDHATQRRIDGVTRLEMRFDRTCEPAPVRSAVRPLGRVLSPNQGEAPLSGRGEAEVRL
jgi:serine/threonine-protein kinase RsbW